MTQQPKPEVWLRGPLPGIPALLQPAAHALLQAREEVFALLNDFPEIFLWVKPVGLASPGFHLQHLTGVLNRLFTYADGKLLNDEQLQYLQAEGKTPEKEYSVANLLDAFSKQVDAAIGQLSNEDEAKLTEVRAVGRAQIPSTVIGLYFHAAEHTMRHVGQLIVTVKILKGN